MTMLNNLKASESNVMLVTGSFVALTELVIAAVYFGASFASDEDYSTVYIEFSKFGLYTGTYTALIICARAAITKKYNRMGVPESVKTFYRGQALIASFSFGIVLYKMRIYLPF